MENVKWWQVVLVLIFAGFVMRSIGSRSAQGENADVKAVRIGFFQAAQNMNTAGPKKLDDDIWFLRAEADGLNFNTYYKLTATSTRTDDLPGFKADVLRAKTEDLCRTPDTKKAMDLGARLGFVYATAKDVEVARVYLDKNSLVCPGSPNKS